MKAARILAWRLTLALILGASVAGCSFYRGAIGFFDTAWALRGAWIIDHASAGSFLSSYYQLTVGVDNVYEIVGYDSQVTERATMRNLSADGFEYAITVQRLYPYRIGNAHWARWSVEDGELEITFYADATQTSTYASFQARRP